MATVRVALRRMTKLLIACGVGGVLPACQSSNQVCSRASDCASSQICGYAIDAGCSAHGTCQDRPAGTQCGGGTVFCGCDGSQVPVGCGDPGDYAPAPVRFFGTCPMPPQDSSVE